ncbi:unnamed protein product [Cylindrotheca closterium]|uniref:RING-type domain-containing protein n=1 Tax=Cylindrotheca closterium TaxID=2856 RepID=A0AAD2CTX7_9STRA|nr:unnamed protein product [Cylindrotheca closterium]
MTQLPSLSFTLLFALTRVGSAAAYYSQICPVTTVVELIEIKNESTSITEYHYQQTNQEIGSNTTAIFRECQCPGPIKHDPFVCPYHTNLCAIPVDVNDSVLCFEDDASTVLVRNIWPLVCLWYIFLCLLCFSYKGRHAITYCVQRCFPNTNGMLVDRILEHHNTIRLHYMNFWNANHPNANASNEEECGELILKTKAYKAEEHVKLEDNLQDLEEDDPSICCTICFGPLQEGDRIASLECKHIFHVECIKGWVQRKNTCPLCATQIAKPRKPSASASASNSNTAAVQNDDTAELESNAV